jgi:hypothetical protein
MHPLFIKASGLTQTIIAACIEVHRENGPGLIESIYEWCLVPSSLCFLCYLLLNQSPVK